jgi:very-short-patch-repair endonuclease
VGPDEAIARLAARQHGVVARAQLLEIGVSPDAIKHRLNQRRLHPMHRGVYLAGQPVPPRLAREAAAILACGLGSAISHRTAARLAGFWSGPEESIDVTVPHASRCQPAGVSVHRTRHLGRAEVRRHEGLPVTGPLRTLVDLAAVLAMRELEQAVAEAQALRLVPRRLPPAQPFPPALRALFDATPALTRSEAEERLLALVRKARLPAPRVNSRVAGHEVDLQWPDRRLAVEVDGYAVHSHRRAFERDRIRDADLVAAGYRVLRFTWRQITQEPEAVVARLARVL